MTWGISTDLFLKIHVALSPIGIASGLIVLYGLVTGHNILWFEKVEQMALGRKDVSVAGTHHAARTSLAWLDFSVMTI